MQLVLLLLLLVTREEDVESRFFCTTIMSLSIYSIVEGWQPCPAYGWFRDWSNNTDHFWIPP